SMTANATKAATPIVNARVSLSLMYDALQAANKYMDNVNSRQTYKIKLACMPLSNSSPSLGISTKPVINAPAIQPALLAAESKPTKKVRRALSASSNIDSNSGNTIPLNSEGTATTSDATATRESSETKTMCSGNIACSNLNVARKLHGKPSAE